MIRRGEIALGFMRCEEVWSGVFTFSDVRVLVEVYAISGILGVRKQKGSRLICGTCRTY